SLPCLAHLDDFVTGAHVAFRQYANVEPGASTRCQQCGHPGLAHPNADPITGDARLSDFEQRAADPTAVADAHGIVGQSFDRAVLAELSVDEVGPLELRLPITVRFDLVDEDGALLTAVPGKVTLTISVQIQAADSTAPTHCILPDP